jgi:integrase
MTTAAEVSVPNPRFPGVEARHARDCPATGWNMDRCTCSPTYRGTAWSRKDGRLLKSPPFASATAAKNWAQDAKVDLRRGVRRAPAPMTVGQLAEAWLEQLDGGLVRTRSGRPYKPSTRIGYRQVIEDWIVPELGQYRLAELDHDVVQEMIERMLSGEADDRQRKKAASTVRNAITALRAMWRHPSARRAQPGNPMNGLALPASTKGRDRYATPGEAATLLAVLPRADKAIWGTALYAGLRRGELMGLRTSDVDVATGLIRVEQAYDARSKKIIPPKSYAGRRKVPIAGLLRSPLVDARARASERGLELVFGRKSGQPFSYNGILDRAKRIWNIHGLEPIGLHECRHTFASLMIAAMSDAGRFNPKVLQTLMGHASITETYDRYGHLMPGSENEAAGMLDRYLAAAADAVRATGETAARGKSAGKTLAVREGLERSPAGGGHDQLSFDRAP